MLPACRQSCFTMETQRSIAETKNMGNRESFDRLRTSETNYTNRTIKDHLSADYED